VEYKTILVTEENKRARITLNRPPFNILNIEMMAEISEALASFQNQNLKVLVLDARHKAFSAGVDVSDHTADKVEDMIRVFHSIFTNLSAIEAPTIAVVNGAALGGGCEVAVFCDLIIASERAKFGQPEVKVGVFPPVAAAIFPKIMGTKKALELLLTGEIIRAAEAKELGLVNHVIPVENFQEDSENFITEMIASNSAPVLRMTKKAFLEGLNNPYQEAIRNIEDIYLNELMKTADANEGLAAFLEKRTPVWKDE